MCYSLLLVTFKNDKARETKECATEQDEREKIADLRVKDQVAKIAVFRCQRHVVREEVWNEVPYSPPPTEPAYAAPVRRVGGTVEEV
jgi:hypothetical protein